MVILIILLHSCTKQKANENAIVIGKTYQGGIIFYIDNTGQHGLIYAPWLYHGDCPWGCTWKTISGADGTAVGTGNQNTIDIENGCSENNTAAHFCANLEIDGYTDWYLPCKGELKLMYSNLQKENLLSDFYKRNYQGSLVFYWSSTEVNDSLAWCQEFETGWSIKQGENSPEGLLKFTFLEVLAIRAF